MEQLGEASPDSVIQECLFNIDARKESLSKSRSSRTAPKSTKPNSILDRMLRTERANKIKNDEANCRLLHGSEL